MKKLVTLLSLLILSVSLSFALINPVYRNLEFGADARIGVGQNLITLSEIFKEKVVIDLSKIYTDMENGNYDFAIDTDGNADLYINSNLSENFAMGLFLDTEFNATAGFSKDLFKLLAYGNPLDQEVKIGLNTGLEAYLDMSVPIKMGFGNLKLFATPTFFVPLAYVPAPELYASALVTSDGKSSIYCKGDVSAYTFFALGSQANTMPSVAALTDSLNDFLSIIANGGFDVSVNAEYAIMNSLDVGVYSRIPLLAGTLNYKTNVRGLYANSFDSLLGIVGGVFGGSSDADSSDDTKFVLPSKDDLTFTYDEFADYKVNRPLRFGLQASWRPFGDWLAIRPAIGFAARNPGGEDFDLQKSMYLEYNMNVDARIFYFLGINFTSSYEKQIYKQQLGVLLNFRIIEVDVNVASRSSDFERSWQVDGAEVSVAVKMGL